MASPTSSNEKKQRRAIAELDNLEKTTRRGQRPAVLKVVDTWLEVPPEARARHFEWVQRLVGSALDELRTKPPSSSVLVEWHRRLEQAPELIRGLAEPEAVGHERWWMLLRAALSMRQVVIAGKLWPRLLAAMKTPSPALVRLVQAWLAAPIEGWSDELVVELSGSLESLHRVLVPDTQGPRLSPIEPLLPEMGHERIREWVEALFCRPERVTGHLLSTARRLSSRERSYLYTEAAPFLLREALMRREVRTLGAFAEALEHAERVDASDITTALNWLAEATLTSLQGQRNAHHEALAHFVRLARIAVLRLPKTREAVLDGLYRVGLTNIHVRHGESAPNAPSRSELAALWTALLRSGPPDLKLWLTAAAALELEFAESLADLHDALEDTRAVLLEDARATTTALAELPEEVHVQRALRHVSYLFEVEFREDVLFALWPLADMDLKKHLSEMFTALIVDHDELAQDSLSTPRSSLLTPELEDELLELVEGGLSPEAAARQVAERQPLAHREELHQALVDFGSILSADLPAACVSLWERLGEEVVRFDPARLEEGLHYLDGKPLTRIALITAALEGHEDIAAWLGHAHDSADLTAPDVFLPSFLEAFSRRFGDSVATWRTAFRSQQECPCMFTATLATAYLHAAISRGEPHQQIFDEVTAVFSDAARQFDGIVRELESAGNQRSLDLVELIAITGKVYTEATPLSSMEEPEWT
ncbi:MAG TPA: hypothetical protein PK095_10475 [Myxococcota bacterium]|nr:hypothetical protein [Myxococcota bacterium]